MSLAANILSSTMFDAPRIEVVFQGSVGGDGNSARSVPLPSDVQENDVVFAIGGTSSSTYSGTAITVESSSGAADYTESTNVDTGDISGERYQATLFYKVQGSTPDTSVRMDSNQSSSGEGNIILIVYVLRYVDTTTPLDVTPTTTTEINASATTIVSPTITPVTLGAVTIAYYGVTTNGAFSNNSDVKTYEAFEAVGRPIAYHERDIGQAGSNDDAGALALLGFTRSGAVPTMTFHTDSAGPQVSMYASVRPKYPSY
jgi:hypothetical protein